MSSIKSFIIFFALFFQTLLGYQYELSVCCIFQNDARFLKEWIDYHRHVGVEHFYMFNNGSQDNFHEVLNPYIDAQVVTLIDWTCDYAENAQWNYIQCEAFSRAIKMSRHVSRWLAIIDTDEFIVPVQKSTIPEVLKNFRDAPALGLNWLMYGTSSVPEILPGERMTYALLMRGLDETPEHLVIKCIVQPEKTHDLVTNPHYFSYKKGWCVNTNGQRIEGAFAPNLTIDQLRINHYWSRDEKFLHEYKIPRRGKMFKDPPERILNDNMRYNLVFDDIMLQKW